MKRLYFASLHECNQNCIFCVRLGKEKPITHINRQEALKILSNKRKEGYDELFFDGGEPTLRKDLVKLVDYAKKLKYRTVQILTNGVLLSCKKNVKDFLKIKTTENFNFSFSVSLHSHKKEISEKLTGSKDTYKKTLKGIANLIECGFKNLSIYTIIAVHNYKYLPDFVEFINKKFPDIKNITFSFIYPAGAARDNMKIYPKLSSVEPYLLKALALCERYKINFLTTTCGTVPLCFLKGYEHLLISQQVLDQPENLGVIDSNQNTQFQLATKEYHNKTKIKSTSCTECAYNDKCAGLWKAYAEKYGLGELRPKINPASGKILLLVVGFSCNNNCIFCSASLNRNFNQSTEELLKKIKNSYNNGYRRIEFIGGEPTIRTDIEKLIQYAKKIGFKHIAITTNGRLLSYDNITEKLVKAGLTYVAFSIYGHNSLLHNGVTRTPGSFDQTITGLKNIIKYPEVKTVVNTVVSRINYKYLQEIGKYFNDLKVREWHLLELLPDGIGIESYKGLHLGLLELKACMEKMQGVFSLFEKIHIFDLPLCIFNPAFFKMRNVLFISPKVKYEDIHQKCSDEKPTRIFKKIKKGRIIYEDKYKIKPNICEKCKHYYVCPGIARPYYNIKKDSEIKKLISMHHLYD